jgi:hypothetical protein
MANLQGLKRTLQGFSHSLQAFGDSGCYVLQSTINLAFGFTAHSQLPITINNGIVYTYYIDTGILAGFDITDGTLGSIFYVGSDAAFPPPSAQFPSHDIFAYAVDDDYVYIHSDHESISERYLSRWNHDGTYVDNVSIVAYTVGENFIAYGDYLYCNNGSHSVYKVDKVTRTLTDTFTVPTITSGAQIRYTYIYNDFIYVLKVKSSGSSAYEIHKLDMTGVEVDSYTLEGYSAAPIVVDASFIHSGLWKHLESDGSLICQSASEGAINNAADGGFIYDVTYSAPASAFVRLRKYSI